MKLNPSVSVVILLWCCSTVLSLTQTEIDLINEHQVNLTQTLVNKTRRNQYYLDYDSRAFPDHATKYFNDIDENKNLAFKVHMNPIWTNDTICLHSGPIAMAYNGVPIFRPYTSRGVNAIEVEYTQFDKCEGHTSPTGKYHYHGPIKCLVNVNETDKFIGVAFDGYPIYGPYDANGEVTKADLDECQGRHEDVDGQSVYRYRMTLKFPYSLGCYHGELFDDKSDDPKCLFPNECGPNPGEIESSDPLYLKCGGGHWSTGKGGKRRQLIEKKLESLQMQAKLKARELYNEIQVEKAQEEKEQLEGKRAYEAHVKMTRKELNQARSLKAKKRANENKDKADVNDNTLRSLLRMVKEMLNDDK